MSESETLSFSLYRRRDGRSSNYFITFRRADGSCTSERSTGKSSRAEALRVASQWLETGLPGDGSPGGRPQSITARLDFAAIRNQLRTMTLSPAEGKELADILTERFPPVPKATPADELLAAFLERCWNYETSPYVKERQAYGHRIGKAHCKTSLSYVKRWKQLFPTMKMADLTNADVTRLMMTMKAEGLSPKTCNAALMVGRTPIQWAVKTGILAHDPFAASSTFALATKERGILELDEVHSLLNVATWEDDRARVATLVAVTTGLRQSEIRAIQLRDIESGTLHVFGWKEAEGQRGTPKNGESRTVPLLPEVEAEIRILAASNPHGDEPTRYVFWGTSETMPIRPEPLIHGLELALGTIGIDRATRLERGIDFHALRHTFTTHVSRSVDASALQSVTGHKTASTFRLYSGHKTQKDLAAVRSAISSILQDKEAVV